MALHNIRHLMSDPMFRELHQAACEGEVSSIERIHVSRNGYSRCGQYFGALQTGERLYRLETPYRGCYVRTRATARQLRAALKGEV